jgi:DNA replication and repair protein RecF
MSTREDFVEEIDDILHAVFTHLTSEYYELSISYDPNSYQFGSTHKEEQFTGKLRKVRDKEILTGRTLIGPHRDDFIFTINNKDVRQHGSQGEHKSVILALRLAEYQLIKNRRNEPPLLLLDDLFVDLDEQRTKKISSLLPKEAQIYITTTDVDAAHKLRIEKNEYSQFLIKDGIIHQN